MAAEAVAEGFKALDAAMWTTGAGGIVYGIRLLFKAFRSDVAEIKTDGEQEKVLAKYKEMADRYQHEAFEQAKRADTFANERNKAIEEVGQLRGEVRALTAHISMLEAQIAKMQSTVENLETLMERRRGPRKTTGGKDV